MTTRKTFKDLVRDRAARTGESYTTARRRVLAQAPARSHHESALLARLLTGAGYLAAHTGRPFTERTVCGLGGGIGFMYAVFEYRGLPPITTIVAQHHPQPWAPAVLDRLGIAHQVEHSASPRAALTALDRHLAAGRAVHCLVDLSGLPWHDTAMPSAVYPVVVTGRDGDDLLLDDDAAAPRRLPADQFAAAWSAHRQGRHQRITLSTPGSAVDVAPALRPAVSTTVAHLTGPVLGNAFDVNFGLSGMRRLAAQLRDEKGKTGWVRRFAAPGALTFATWRLYECLEIQHTAPAATRPLYADFLDEAAAVLRDDRLSDAAESWRLAGGHWSAVAALAREIAGPGGPIVTEGVWQKLAGPGGDAAADDAGKPDVAEPAQGDRPALLAGLADEVDEAIRAEEEALAALGTL